MSAERRMRVLIVTLGRRGGVTEYGWLMGRALARDCDVAVICSEYAENRQKWETLEVPLLSVKTFSSLTTVIGSYFNAPRFARMRSFARSFDPDIVYYPGGHAWKPVLDILLPRRARIILTVHDPELHSGEDSVLHRVHNAINRFRVDGYVILNESAKERFVRRNALAPEQVIVLPHGVFDDYADEDVPVEAPAEASAVNDRYLLFVGRLLPYKGLAVLLRAYAQHDGHLPPLVVAGSGQPTDEERYWIGEVASKHQLVLINRWLSDSEMAALVQRARFVVLPYTSATQSGVIPLASAFGVPAIASDTDGLAEQVVEGETGWLFPPGDSEALGRIIDRLAAMSDADYEAMSARVRNHAESNWSWRTLAGRLIEFFRKTTGSA